MAQGVTVFNDITPARRPWFIRELLDRAQESQVYSMFAQHAEIPQNEGDRIAWRRYDNYPTVTTPLTDGVYGRPRKPTYQDITAQVEMYGDYTKVTKKTVITNLEKLTMEITKVHGQQAGETFDELMRDCLYSGASYVNASNGVNGSTPTEITLADVDTAVKRLINNRAKRIAPMIEAGSGQGTAPVSKAYFAFAHADLRDDLRDMDDWQPVSTYASQKPTYEDELGAAGGVRFIETSNGKLTSGTYSIFIVGENAYGDVQLAGNGYNVYRHGFGSGGVSDPQNMFMTIAWDGLRAQEVLNDNWLVDLRVTHS